MDKFLNATVNKNRYRFYKMYHIGEMYYSISFENNGRKEMFVMRKNSSGNWCIAGKQQLPGFVLASEYQLSCVIENMERLEPAQ